MEEFTFEEEEAILPPSSEMEEVEEQTRLLRQLYSETLGERVKEGMETHSFTNPQTVPLSLTPGIVSCNPCYLFFYLFCSHFYCKTITLFLSVLH